MTVGRVIREVAARLAARHAAHEARFLVSGVLGLRTVDFGARSSRAVDQEGLRRVGDSVERRLAGEPLAYILGNAAFRELELSVDGRVLIPRPETELVVEQVMKLPVPAAGRVLEVGTGSGAIALSLLHEGRFQRVVATDLSAAALEVAAANAGALGLAERVDFRLGGAYDPVGSGETFDVVVSNPPYVAESERGFLPAEVERWEPATALFAGDGLAVIGRLVAGAGSVLAPGGWLVLEIGADQGVAARGACVAAGLRGVRVVPDLAGRDRMVVARAARGE